MASITSRRTGNEAPGERRTAAPRRLRLADASLGDLGVIRDFVLRSARDLGADEECSADLVQAVDELATNVLRHGYAGNEGPLDVALESRDGWLVVALRDEAPPFDPTGWPSPDPHLPLNERAPGGLGIHLVRTSVDRMEHALSGPRGNLLTLSRRSSRSDGGSAA
jgi:serine/threonine-protein kinase RsbW